MKNKLLLVGALALVATSAAFAQTATPVEQMKEGVEDAVSIWDLVYPIIISVTVFGIFRRLSRKAG